MRGKSGQLLGVAVGAVVLGLVALAVLSKRPPKDLLVLQPVVRVPLGPGLDGRGLSRRPRKPSVGNAALRGIVLAAGRPVVAEVTLFRRASEERYLPPALLPPGEPGLGPAGATRSAEDGTFAFEGVPRGSYQVTARSAEHGYGSIRVPVGVAERAVHRIELVPANQRLHGTVFDQHGAPFGRVLTAFEASGWMLGSAEAARSQIHAGGRFELVGLTAGTWGIQVQGEGISGSLVFVDVPQPGALALRVRRPERTIPVRVVEAGGGAPIAQAVVTATWIDAYVHVVQQATTGPDGLVTLGVVSNARLHVEAEGYAWQDSSVGSETGEIRIALRRASRLVGRALRVGTQEAVAGLAVRVSAPGCEPVTTDAQGRYVLEGVPPGRWDIAAIGPGGASVGLTRRDRDGWNPLAVDVIAGVEVAHDLLIEPAASLGGRVLGASGAPIAGARVAVLTSLKPLLDAPPPTMSDSEGRYAFEGLPPQGNVEVVATAEGWDGRAGSVMNLQPGPNAIDLTLEPATWLDMRVRAARDGSPLQGAAITVGRPGIGGTEATTDAEGLARVGPLGGAAWVQVEAVGHVGVRLDVPPGSPYEVRLEPGLPLSGRVEDAEGRPAPVGTPVSATCNEAVSDPAPVRTDTEGRFAFAPVAPGTWEIRVGGFPALGSVEADAGRDDIVVRLEPRPAQEPDATLPLVRVRVRSGDREPIASGRVALLQTGETRETAFEGAEASLLLPGRSASEPFHVVVWGARDEAGMLHGPTSAGPFAADTRDVEVRLPPASTLLGRVEGLPPEFVRGVVVEAYPYLETLGWNDFLGSLPKGIEHLELPEDGKLTARCAADGSFKVGGLVDRPFALVALLPPGWYQEDEEIGDPGEYVRLRVRRGVDVTVTVLSESGEPLAGVDVRAHYDVDHPPHERPLYDAHQAWSDVHTDGDGRVRLVGLRSRAVYTLNVRPSDEHEHFKHYDEEWPPRGTVLRLKRAFAIEGVVRDRDGKPVDAACVRLWNGRDWNTYRTDEGGAFEFKGLDPGSYPISGAPYYEALPSDPAPDAPRFAAGTRDVVIAIDRGVELVIEGLGGTDGEPRGLTTYVRTGDRLEHAGVSTRAVGPASARLLGLDPGRSYVLFVPPVVEDPTYGMLEIGPPIPKNARMTLKEGVSVRLRFEGHADLPELGTAMADSTSGLSMRLVVDASGRALGVPPGTWTLRIRTRGEDGAWYRGEVTVATSETELTLRRKRD